MEKVTSPDGTTIACYRRGTGTPLVLVHGSGAANALAWLAVLAMLEARFSLVIVDRRGHGKSSDSPTYAIEREFEDIAAVVDSLGEPAYLLGHSFGALCALEAALLTRNLRKLVLYEPGISLPGVSLYPAGVIERLESLLAVGDREGILTMLYHEVVGMPTDEIEQLRSSRAWPARLATAHTLPRESRAEEQYTFEAQRFKTLQTPTLLLLGSDSPPVLKAATETVAAALPNSRIAVLPGQQHIAMYTAPDLFVSELVRFLLEPL
ncbi:MAG: alpha/beta hydrolase [Anaerolineae bacterium]|nr:alpha/beta hydrolase [Anaerolineae bacterium]